MNKSLKRIMAVLLLICMMGMNLSTIGIYGITYALSEDEISKFDIKFDKESNTWNWNTEVDSKVHILFSDEQQKYLKKVCEEALETDAEFTDEIWITLENIYDSL